MSNDLKVRLSARLSEQAASGCICWTGPTNPQGYGRMWIGPKQQYVHRIAMFLASGKWPVRHVLHTCDNPRCCNPEHLIEGSHADNMKDCARKGRNKTPRIGNGRRKLSERDYLQICALSAIGVSRSELARRYGVSRTCIRKVAARSAA